MKKITAYLFFGFIIASAFFSCKKEASSQPEKLHEKWIFERTIGVVYDSDGEIVETYNDEEYTLNDYLSLKPDGKFEWVERDRIITGTYRIENSDMTLNYQEAASSSTTFSITIKATIVEKSASSFIYYIEETGSDSKYRLTTYLRKQ